MSVLSLVVSAAVVAGYALAAVALFVALAILAIRALFFAKKTEPGKCSIAFFHPYCDAGGGGERVLWCAIQSLASARDASHLKVVIYTGDVGTPPEAILEKAQSRFGLSMPELDMEFVYVTQRHLLEAKRYPRFTMLGQSLGSMVLAWECLRAFNPDVFIDTTGCHFTFIVAKLLAGCRVGAYVHYPTITTDMLQAVYERRPSYNNTADIATSEAATTAKAVYYRLFSWAYAFAGGFTDATMCNSSWTKNHIDSLWSLPGGGPRSSGTGAASGRVAVTPTSLGRGSDSSDGLDGAHSSSSSVSASGSSSVIAPDKPGAVLAPLLRGVGLAARPAARTVYPPCNTQALSELPLGSRQRTVVSVGQFRPEKDHPLQLRAFAAFRKRDPAAFSDVRLLLIGGCRGAEDEARVASLKSLAAELGLSMPTDVEFVVNAPLAELQQRLGEGTAGLHTMWNEHFGICVVELMAAGTVPIAHNSGGPRADIVVPFHGHQTGFLAATPEEYAAALERVFSMSADELYTMAAAGRASVARFSDEEFQLSFYAGVVGLVRAGMSDLRTRRGLGTAAGGGGKGR